MNCSAGRRRPRAEAEELRGRSAELAERLAQVEERLSRLVIAREVVDEVLDGAAAEAPPTAVPQDATVPAGPGRPPVTGVPAVVGRAPSGVTHAFPLNSPRARGIATVRKSTSASTVRSVGESTPTSRPARVSATSSS
jgi:hypothetical protein